MGSMVIAKVCDEIMAKMAIFNLLYTVISIHCSDEVRIGKGIQYLAVMEM